MRQTSYYRYQVEHLMPPYSCFLLPLHLIPGGLFLALKLSLKGHLDLKTFPGEDVAFCRSRKRWELGAAKMNMAQLDGGSSLFNICWLHGGQCERQGSALWFGEEDQDLACYGDLFQCYPPAL